MTLEELINEGEVAKVKCLHESSMGLDCISGEEHDE